MTHTEAAERSNRFIAVRYDGTNHRCALYSSKANMLVLQADDDGANWLSMDPSEASKYRDWEPANETVIDKIIGMVCG